MALFRIFVYNGKENSEMLTIQKLIELQHILKIMPLAEQAGISPHAIAAKMRRGTQLNVDEASALEVALKPWMTSTIC